MAKKFPKLGTIIKKYHQHAMTGIALPLTISKSGRNAGYATGPRGKKYLLARDPYDANKIWIMDPGKNHSLGWI